MKVIRAYLTLFVMYMYTHELKRFFLLRFSTIRRARFAESGYPAVLQNNLWIPRSSSSRAIRHIPVRTPNGVSGTQSSVRPRRSDTRLGAVAPFGVRCTAGHPGLRIECAYWVARYVIFVIWKPTTTLEYWVFRGTHVSPAPALSENRQMGITPKILMPELLILCMTLDPLKLYPHMKFHFNSISCTWVIAFGRKRWDVRTDGQTDRQTDGRTDGQTYDGEVIPKCHLCLQQETQKSVIQFSWKPFFLVSPFTFGCEDIYVPFT